MTNFAFDSFHSDDAFCALLPQVKALLCIVEGVLDAKKYTQSKIQVLGQKIEDCINLT